jgi:hypothetical protein
MGASDQGEDLVRYAAMNAADIGKRDRIPGGLDHPVLEGIESFK